MKIIRTEAGSGGKKGHGNMAHYDPTEVIKARMKKARRPAPFGPVMTPKRRALLAEMLKTAKPIKVSLVLRRTGLGVIPPPPSHSEGGDGRGGPSCLAVGVGDACAFGGCGFEVAGGARRNSKAVIQEQRNS